MVASYDKYEVNFAKYKDICTMISTCVLFQKKGLELSNRTTKTTRLHRACKEGDLAKVKEFIEDMNGQELMRRCSSKYTALHYAIEEGKMYA